MRRRSVLAAAGCLFSLSGCTGSPPGSSGRQPSVDNVYIFKRDYSEPRTIFTEEGEQENPDAEKSTQVIERHQRSGTEVARIRFSYSGVFHDDVTGKRDYVIRAILNLNVVDENGETVGTESKRQRLTKRGYDNFDENESIESFTQDWMRFADLESLGEYQLRLTVKDEKTGQESQPATFDFRVVDVVPWEYNRIWDLYRGGFLDFVTAEQYYSRARSRYQSSELEAAEESFNEASELYAAASTKIGLNLVDINNELLTEEMREIGEDNMKVLDTHQKAAVNFAREIRRRLRDEDSEAQKFKEKANENHEAAQQLDNPPEPEAFKQQIWGEK